MYKFSPPPPPVLIVFVPVLFVVVVMIGLLRLGPKMLFLVMFSSMLVFPVCCCDIGWVKKSKLYGALPPFG
jgi:hypothetical protein